MFCCYCSQKACEVLKSILRLLFLKPLLYIGYLFGYFINFTTCILLINFHSTVGFIWVLKLFYIKIVVYFIVLYLIVVMTTCTVAFSSSRVLLLCIALWLLNKLNISYMTLILSNKCPVVPICFLFLVVIYKNCPNFCVRPCFTFSYFFNRFKIY